MGGRSQSQIAEPGMLVGAPPQGPMVFPLGLVDGDVVDAGVAYAHQPALVELPVLVAIRTEPLARRVMPLVREAYRDAIAVEGPHLFDQSIVQLFGPLALEERHDLCSSIQEFRAIPPARVFRIS